jgi:hypothetical protein
MDETEKAMRFYAAGNMYLSSIQQGIQAFHCLGEMTLDYTGNKMFEDWLSIHKTLICVNGGNNESLQALYALLSESEYPVAKFHEDEASMAGMLTCVGIIVPEKIYNTDIADIETALSILTPWEFNVASALRRMPLAR